MTYEHAIVIGTLLVCGGLGCSRDEGPRQVAAQERAADETIVQRKQPKVPISWPKATVTDKAKLGEAVADGSVTVNFTVEGEDVDAFTILCRAGDQDDLTKNEKEECQDEFEITDIADDKPHTFEIYARHGESKEERLLDTVTFTHEVYEIVVAGEAQLRTQLSGIIHLGLSINKPRPVYFTCGAETSFWDPSLECRNGHLMVNLNRYAGGVYFTFVAYDAVTHKKLVERNVPFCPGQLCAQGIGLVPPPSEAPPRTL